MTAGSISFVGNSFWYGML